MDYSEFLRRLGADPGDQNPEILEARRSSEKFEQAARDAEQFESKLIRAITLPMPDSLMKQIAEISHDQTASSQRPRRWRHLAVAAGLLIAVGAAGITWNLNRGWESVDEYVVDHYRHDGEMLVQTAGGTPVDDVQKMLARFDMTVAPQLADVVSIIKYCPTPDGKGVHMVLNTSEGPVTVIYMPETGVVDHQGIEFDGMDALYVSLQKGSAIIIGKHQQGINSLYSLVQQSIVPVENEA